MTVLELLESEDIEQPIEITCPHSDGQPQELWKISVSEITQGNYNRLPQQVASAKIHSLALINGVLKLVTES